MDKNILEPEIDILSSAVCGMPLVIIIRWYVKHGRWESADPDYLLARKHMKWAFKLWLVANAFNIIVVLVGSDPSIMRFLITNS